MGRLRIPGFLGDLPQLKLHVNHLRSDLEESLRPLTLPCFFILDIKLRLCLRSEIVGIALSATLGRR